MKTFTIREPWLLILYFNKIIWTFYFKITKYPTINDVDKILLLNGAKESTFNIYEARDSQLPHNITFKLTIIG